MYKLLGAAALLSALPLMAAQKTPVLVELFTSEGCSSCPPADDLLARLAAQQAVEGVDIIVLSEHVDYWNQLGWKDPYSSSMFSERQRQYAVTLHSEDVYTPQAVVDGATGGVGSNSRQILSAIQRAATQPKIPLAVSAEKQANQVSIKVDGNTNGEVWVALVEAKAVSHVVRGENGGRTLQHVGVVRVMQPLKGGSGIVHIHPDWGTNGLRVVAFVQDKHSMKIIGAAEITI